MAKYISDRRAKKSKMLSMTPRWRCFMDGPKGRCPARGPTPGAQDLRPRPAPTLRLIDAPDGAA